MVNLLVITFKRFTNLLKSDKFSEKKEQTERLKADDYAERVWKLNKVEWYLVSAP